MNQQNGHASRSQKHLRTDGMIHGVLHYNGSGLAVCVGPDVALYQSPGHPARKQWGDTGEHDKMVIASCEQ